jgi:hypothetical protein
MSTSRALAVRCEYRNSGYSSQEIQQLREELAEISNAQFRPQGIPEAGASFDIAFIVQWLGIAAAGGVVGNAAYDLLKGLARKLSDFYKRKERTSGFPPDIDYLDLRFDDFDLRIHGGKPEQGGDCNFLQYDTLAHLPAIVQFVMQRVLVSPLSETTPLTIDIYEPHITLDAAGGAELNFDLPWKVEGIIKCHYWSYFPATNSLEEGYTEPESEG